MRLENQIASDTSFNPPDPLAEEYPRDLLVVTIGDHPRTNAGNVQFAAKRSDLSRLHIERDDISLGIEPRLGGRIGDFVDGSKVALGRKNTSRSKPVRPIREN